MVESAKMSLKHEEKTKDEIMKNSILKLMKSQPLIDENKPSKHVMRSQTIASHIRFDKVKSDVTKSPIVASPLMTMKSSSCDTLPSKPTFPFPISQTERSKSTPLSSVSTAIKLKSLTDTLSFIEFRLSKRFIIIDADRSPKEIEKCTRFLTDEDTSLVCVSSDLYFTLDHPGITAVICESRKSNAIDRLITILVTRIMMKNRDNFVVIISPCNFEILDELGKGHVNSYVSVDEII